MTPENDPKNAQHTHHACACIMTELQQLREENHTFRERLQVIELERTIAVQDDRATAGSAIAESELENTGIPADHPALETLAHPAAESQSRAREARRRKPLGGH